MGSATVELVPNGCCGVRAETAYFTRLAKAFQPIGATLDHAMQVSITFLDEADPSALARWNATTSLLRATLIVATPDKPAASAALRDMVSLS